MKKIFFLAAMLSFLAIYSCQDNAVPENNKETVEGSYTIGDRSGEITSAYYGISSTGECRLILVPDGLAYTQLPPYEFFCLDIRFPEQTPKLQPGTYTMPDGGIKEAGFAEVTESDEEMHIFESANAELSETGDYYTLTLSGTRGDDMVSVTYTGPFFELDYETLNVLGSGSYSIGNFSSSLGYAYADLDYDELKDRTNLDLYICSVPENVKGTNEINQFNFDLYFPGRVSELQPGTYQETDDDIINLSRCSYYDEAGESHSIYFETLTLKISEEGTDYNYKIKADGILTDDSTVSVDFSGYVTYGYY